jgi:hypothetical protein
VEGHPNWRIVSDCGGASGCGFSASLDESTVIRMRDSHGAQMVLQKHLRSFNMAAGKVCRSYTNWGPQINDAEDAEARCSNYVVWAMIDLSLLAVPLADPKISRSRR